MSLIDQEGVQVICSTMAAMRVGLSKERFLHEAHRLKLESRPRRPGEASATCGCRLRWLETEVAQMAALRRVEKVRDPHHRNWGTLAHD